MGLPLASIANSPLSSSLYGMKSPSPVLGRLLMTVFALIVTFVYNVFLILFNAAFNGTFIARAELKFNYGYLLFPPGSLKDFVLSFPPFLYYLIMLIGYELLILLLYAFGRFLNKVCARKPTHAV